MTAISTELEHLMGKAITDFGGTANAALIIVGARLGLFTGLAEIGPATPAELAEHTNTRERYIREWLAAQAASGYVTYDPATARFSLSPEQKLLFADEDSPAYMVGGFFSSASTIIDEPKITRAFRSGDGIAWGDHHGCLFCGTEKFFRPSYTANLIQHWIPALEGVEERLQSGAIVADLGCGHAVSTLVMAKAFPASTFIGFDNHEPSIARAREAAAAEGLTNVRFEVGTAQDFPSPAEIGLKGNRYDFIAIFDALHDMGDPRGAARRVKQMLRPDGTWMIVEPFADDALENNLNPVSRAYYAMSTACCVPSALSQAGGEALGAQAGAKAITEVVQSGGFVQVRVACQSPVNLVIEARP